MKTGWRIGLNIALWAVAFPIVGVVASILERTVFPTITTDPLPVPITWAALILWAAWIYWRCVPPAPNAPQGLGYFALFAALMGLVGYLALHVAMLAVIMIFGL